MNKILFFVMLYLIGSIPFAYLVVKWRNGKDIRKLGDGNVGAQNVWNTIGPFESILVLTGDCLKGFFAFWLARWLFSQNPPYEIAAIAVVLGHDFSIYLKGYGGKGMAATIGFLVAYNPLATLVGIVMWGLSMLITRHFELSAGIGWATIPLQIWKFYHNSHRAIFAAILLAVIGIKKLMDLPRERRLKEAQGG